MNKIDFKNLPDTTTPLSAENLNLLQDNVEDGISDGVSEAKSYTDTKVLETYSTTEQVIGTWLGKPLYRQVISTTTPSSTSVDTIGTITNIDKIVKLDGFITYSNQQVPLTFAYSTTVLNAIMIEGTNVRCKITANAYLNCPCIVIAEYTKTTD